MLSAQSVRQHAEDGEEGEDEQGEDEQDGEGDDEDDEEEEQPQEEVEEEEAEEEEPPPLPSARAEYHVRRDTMVAQQLQLAIATATADQTGNGVLPLKRLRPPSSLSIDVAAAMPREPPPPSLQSCLRLFFAAWRGTFAATWRSS